MNSTKTDTHTQNAIILKHLKRYKKQGITQLQATVDYGILRLSARIYELRKAGHNIKAVKTYQKNRYGRTSEVCTYILEE